MGIEPKALAEDALSPDPGSTKGMPPCYSQDKRLNKLLDTVLNEVRLYAEAQISSIKRLAQIGVALSAEKDINRLLELIVDEARQLTNADAGTLYTVDPEAGELRFSILQNDTMKTRLGGTSGEKVLLPPIPLERNGKFNYDNVSSYVALTGKTVNIADVYETDLFDFSGPRTYDAATGYRSRSMLVIPMRNHENDIIGVLQLLNALDLETGEVIAFSDDDVDLIASLASQAAVALTNAQLILDLKNLFYAFIKSIATAVDEKSPYTGGHITRVVDLTMMIAEGVNAATEGPLAEVHLSEEEIEELRLAAWMHDVGKITTPEFIIDKRTKLETVFDRVQLVATRFDLIEQLVRGRCLAEKVQLLEDGAPPERLAAAERSLEEELQLLDEEKALVMACNSPVEYLGPEKAERLKAIGNKCYVLNGQSYPYLTEDEIRNLLIPKGSLSPEERKLIEYHSLATLKILKELPFPKRLRRVPEFAAAHHEKLNGKGYPFGLSGEEIPIQARIMVIADIFEALTARDRPYKVPMKLSQAIKILGFMKKDNEIDPDILDMFLAAGLPNIYAERELSPEQID